jgi:hypothetical protein
LFEVLRELFALQKKKKKKKKNHCFELLFSFSFLNNKKKLKKKLDQNVLSCFNTEMTLIRAVLFKTVPTVLSRF